MSMDNKVAVDVARRVIGLAVGCAKLATISFSTPEALTPNDVQVAARLHTQLDGLRTVLESSGEKLSDIAARTLVQCDSADCVRVLDFVHARLNTAKEEWSKGNDALADTMWAASPAKVQLENPTLLVSTDMQKVFFAIVTSPKFSSAITAGSTAIGHFKAAGPCMDDHKPLNLLKARLLGLSPRALGKMDGGVWGIVVSLSTEKNKGEAVREDVCGSGVRLE